VGHKWVTFSFLSAKNIIKKKKNIQQLFWLTTRVTVFQEEKKSLSCIEFFLLSSDSMTFQPDAHVFFLDVIACCVTKSALRFIARLNFHKQSAILFFKFQWKIFFFRFSLDFLYSSLWRQGKIWRPLSKPHRTQFPESIRLKIPFQFSSFISVISAYRDKCLNS
jgi:hypothetical protein